MRGIELDRFDYQILEALQKDARATHQKLAQEVPLSASQIGRRIQRLEEVGIIQGYHIALRPDLLDLSVTAFANVSLQEARRYGRALRWLAQEARMLAAASH